jgi:hypothetical protein
MALPYFGHQGLKLDVVGLPEFIHGVERAKILTVRFMRGAFSRGGKQVRRRFINEQLKGPPGIKGGELAKGRNVFSRVYGDHPDNIGVQVGISRILHVHEKGMTIHSKGGGPLYLQKRSKGKRVLFQKGSKEDSTILAVVNEVVIPARLHFRKLAESMGPAIVLKAAQEAMRATDVAISTELKKVLARV